MFASPADLAEDLAALVAEGRGVLMPSLDEPHIEYRGVQTLSGDFPTDFQRGLSPVIEHGITVYPIAIRIDGDTGDAVFYNANETSFYTVPRIAPANWLTLLHPLFPSNPWFAESRVIAQWTLVPEESLDGYLAASAPPPAPQLRSTPSPSGTLEVTNLMFTAISASDSNVVLDVAWPTNDIPPDGILDLYFKPDLATNVWTFLDSATPTGPTNATFTVDGADLPGFIHDEPPHVHDASCLPITNIIQSVFLPGEVETNIVYSCQTNPPAPPVTGFFRIGTRQDTDGDGLPDAYETMVSQTAANRRDTDSDGLWDGSELWIETDPLTADTDGDGLSDAAEVGEHYTDSLNPDSDRDGLNDGVEAAMGTDPLHSDSDEDGLPDGWETEHGLDPLDNEDAQADADGDGISNLDEYEHGTNPGDASDWRAAEWFILRADGAEDVVVSDSWTTTIPAGCSSLVVIFSHSEEYPQYTGTQSEYNDLLHWSVTATNHARMYDTIDVNDRHGDWDRSFQSGVCVKGFSPVCVEDMAFFTAPTNESLTLGIQLQGENISDSLLPSSLIVGVFPLELAQGNMPTGTGHDNSSDGAKYHRVLIPQQGIAYVTAQPAAAALSAQIKGLPDFIDIDWRFDLEGERAERNPTDCRRRPENTTERYHIVGDAVMDIGGELSNEIVGGYATLSIAARTDYYADTSPWVYMRYPFRIRGKNPLDATAQAYINANVDAEFQSFAWAIVRHESRAGNRVYNQFNPNASQPFFEQPNKTKGEEKWGFGMAQIDRGEDGRTTDVAWDWHANIAEMNEVLREKKRKYNVLLGYYRQEYQATEHWSEPPSPYTLNGATLTAEQWGTITLYNGPSGIVYQSTSTHTNFRCPWEFIPETGTWILHQNGNRYTEKIATEIVNNSSGANE